MKKVDILFVFHLHLPYIFHYQERHCEEEWYFQNLAESYIPFLMMFEELFSKGIAPNLTVSISPTLYSMMDNDEMSLRFSRYLEQRLFIIAEERKNTNDRTVLDLLDMYEEKYLGVQEYFDKYSGDIITPFKIFKSEGFLEIITTPLTYPILPLLTLKESIDFQITEAVRDFKDKFLSDINGIFLPECAWDERVGEALIKNSIRYTFLDGRFFNDGFRDHVFKHKNGISIFLRNFHIHNFLFGRDGLVKNPYYREFYRDIAWERGSDFLKRYLGYDFPVPTGLKYYRITDVNIPLDKKELYDIKKAFENINLDVKKFADFILECSLKIDNPIFVCVFNAELFGHRWFEGIDFLKEFFTMVRKERYPLSFITPTNYLRLNNVSKMITPYVSSWGDDGFFGKYLNEKNDFIYPYIHEITKKTIEVVNRFKNTKVSLHTERILRQIIIQVLIMQSSDWAYLIYDNTYKEYAEKRIKCSYENALRLISMLLGEKEIDMNDVQKLERENPIFPLLNWRNFSSTSCI